MSLFTAANWTPWNTVVLEPKFHQYSFEKVNIDSWYEFAESYMHILIVLAVACYLSLVLILSNYMKNKKAYELRGPLFCWNVLVAVFSTVVFYRLFSEVISFFEKPHGFYRSVCLRENLHMSSAFWGVVLPWSRPLFMADTAFLILRKKPVDAVHIIHHTSAMVGFPIMVHVAEPILRWLGLANLFVHSIDYFILALRSLKIQVPFARQIMAALEVAQMLFAIFISAYTLVMNATGNYCMRHPMSVLITYGIYFGLLIVLIITLLRPEYWTRGMKKNIKKD